MLQPRRLAARAAAHRMATTLGDSVGETVGYRMRLDTKVGAQDQNRSSHGRRPAVACSRAILRSALTRSSSSMNFTSGASQTDTGLALCLESQRLFRRISASLADCRPCWTVDRSRISWAGARNRLRRPALSFRGDIATLDQPLSGHLDVAVVQSIRRSLAQDQAQSFGFSARHGRDSSRRTKASQSECRLEHPHHAAPWRPASSGARPRDRSCSTGHEKDQYRPPPIAETSLTLMGYASSSMPACSACLASIRARDLRDWRPFARTQDSAEQRRGRAGRLEPGVCSRLWTSSEHQSLAPRRPPEMLDADLAPLLPRAGPLGHGQSSRRLSWLTPHQPGLWPRREVAHRPQRTQCRGTDHRSWKTDGRSAAASTSRAHAAQGCAIKTHPLGSGEPAALAQRARSAPRPIRLAQRRSAPPPGCLA